MLKFDYHRDAALTSIPEEVLTFQWQEVPIDFQFNHFAKKQCVCVCIYDSNQSSKSCTFSVMSTLD